MGEQSKALYAKGKEDLVMTQGTIKGQYSNRLIIVVRRYFSN